MFRPARLASLAALALSAVLIAAATVTGPAAAQLSADFRNLLIAADQRQDDAAFRETAELVASLAGGGEAEVRAVIAADLPHRLDLVADWPTAAPAAPAAPAVVAEAPAASEAEVEADIDTGMDTDGDGSWITAPLAWAEPEAWEGRVRLGVQLQRGNSELTDYVFALDLAREFSAGWAIDAKAEYYYSENATAVSRDNWLTEARLSRQVVDRLGWYVAGSYQQDAIGSYARSATLTGGGLWQVIERERMNWALRAGLGQRYREDQLGLEETGWIAELGSVFDYAITEGTDFSSETTLYGGEGSKLEQRFALTTAIAGAWAIETGLDIEHEFEDVPGTEPTDTRLNASIVREF